MFSQRGALCLDCKGTGRLNPSTCSVCNGSGSIKEICSGTISNKSAFEGVETRIEGAGDYGKGDLIVRVIIEQDSRY